jgi:nucleoside-diphosphate-sugar epimerase
MRIVVAGFGDVGSRLGRRLAKAGHAVLGLRRQPGAPIPGIEQRAVDLAALRAGELADWQADAVVFIAAPDAREPAAYRRTFLDAPVALIDALGAVPSCLLFFGSTAVYGEGATPGAWIDESTPAQPDSWNGELLREAELALQSRGGDAVVLLRCAGLYGPGREWMLRRARAGEPGSGRWTNRLHVDDAAAAVAHLLQAPHRDDVYLLCDGAPAPEWQVLADLRALLGLPAVTLHALLESGRRLDSGRLRASGWQPHYADHRAGYAALLRDAANHRV